MSFFNSKNKRFNVESMDVIEPKRLVSLESFTLTLSEYGSLSKAPGSATIKINGFTTVADLKRQIWIQHQGNPEWSPNRLWIAQESEEGLYKPLDMSWDEQPDFEDGIPAPSKNPGKPDQRLVDSDGNRKAVYPVLNEGLLLESVFSDLTNLPVLTVYTLESLVRAVGLKLDDPAVLHGYIQMYFPKIQSKKETIEAKDESYKQAAEYIKQRIERVATIDSLLKDERVRKSEPFRLRHLRRWKAQIPALTDDKSLALRFYEFHTSEHVPFLRFFPSKSRTAPLLKLATGPAGFPLISDKDMLAAFLDEEPNTDFGAVLMAKIPFEILASEVRAIRNVALSIYWLEDGSAYALLEAPRRDMPLEFNVFEEAYSLLRAALKSLGYPDDTEINLDELSASYRIEVNSSKKLSQKDVLDRVAFFSPFLEASTYQDKSKVNLKWKAVNNYEQEGAVYSYLTKRVLEDDVEAGDEAKDRVQQYVAGIMEEFGRSEVDAKRLFDDWFRRRTEVVSTGADPVSAHNTGVEIEITLSHPVYFVSFVGIDSEQTFNRLISIMTVFFYYTKTAGAEAVVEAPQAPVVNKVVAVAAAAAAKPELRGWLDLLGGEEEEEEEEPAAVVAAPAPALAPGDARKVTLEPLKEWWKTQLDLYDEKLFGYSQTDKTVTVYSRTCQSSSARQPNVMVAEQLDALVKEYGDAVEWVFLPPPENIILDVYALSNKDLIQEMTTRGFEDILDEAGKPKKKAVLQQIFEDALCAEDTVQGQFCRILRKKEKPQPGDKPIWFVARAGSNPEKPNYYICAEFWCVRDMRPIIPSEFRNNKTRHGQPKTVNSCPFCGGTIIEDMKHPKQGQTVSKRKEKPGKGEIHEIAGYMDNIHPQKFALPCCFTRPTVTQIKPAEGTLALPVDKRTAADVVEEEVPAQEATFEEPEPDTDENEALTKVLRTIRTQYVLKYEKRQLEPGRIGLCPPGLDEILGQVGAQSVMKSVGVAQHFKPSAKVFVRFGLGNRGSRPGLNFLELIGFYLGNLQKAGKPAVKGVKFDTPTVLTPHAVLRQIFPETVTKADEKFQIGLRRAFERANYGNLVHEFAGSADELSQGEIQQFATLMGFNLKTENQHMRQHIVRFANAWHNFLNYVRDENAPKDLSHFESMFACPNVIFPQGLLLVVFEGSTDEVGNQTVKIRCPDYGVSEFSQKYKPPVSFLWHDIATNAYEPLVYIEGVEEKDKKGKQQYLVFPTLHQVDPKFSYISQDVQTSMRDFLTQYFSYVEGCGRYSSPAHPWMPDLPSQLVPRISELLTLKPHDAVPTAVLRDRSNRLVGLIYTVAGTELYVPALEDGSLALQLKSVYDVESLPQTTPLDTLLTQFTAKAGLGKFPGLKPSEILIKGQKFSALRLACGAIVPFAPFPITSATAHPMFSTLMKTGAKPIAILPWTEDIRFLRMSQFSTETMDVVPEAVVEEAYQYLRISLSEWLQTNNKDAKKVLRQLKGLRESRLPLYELRRRGDILLEPIIHNWIDVSPHKEAIPALSLLRKDCRVETQEGCSSSSMCSWIGSECKIHAGTSSQIPDIKVYFTSRIIDEVMRYPSRSDEILNQEVSKISSPMGIVRTKDEILTTKGKISDLAAELDLDYVPQDEYSAGLTYPEDAHDELMGRPQKPERIDLPQEWKKSGLHRLPADPAIEDRFIASITAATGLKYKIIESMIKAERKKLKMKPEATIQWNDVDWFCFANSLEASIIFTRYNEETDSSRPYKWFNGGADQYFIVFVVDRPELLQSVKNPLTLDDVPKSIQTFLDTSFATNLKAAQESV